MVSVLGAGSGVEFGEGLAVATNKTDDGVVVGVGSEGVAGEGLQVKVGGSGSDSGEVDAVGQCHVGSLATRTDNGDATGRCYTALNRFEVRGAEFVPASPHPRRQCVRKSFRLRPSVPATVTSLTMLSERNADSRRPHQACRHLRQRRNSQHRLPRCTSRDDGQLGRKIARRPPGRRGIRRITF